MAPIGGGYGRRSSSSREESGGRGGRGGSGPGGRGPGGGARGSRDMGDKVKVFRKKACRLCGERISLLDFKDTERLMKFMTEKGKILPQRISGNCAPHQRMLAKVVKRARHASMVPFQIGG